MSKLPLVYDLDLPALTDQLTDWGEPVYRAIQIWQGLYHHLWVTPQEFTPLPQKLRLRLAESYAFTSLHPEKYLSSTDQQTSKVLHLLPDHQPVETVLMGYTHRHTLCVSTQAGCAMGCLFCATGQMGYRRNLSAGEIVEQVLYFARLLKSQADHLTNIVIMGMGEPFHNYDATMAALDRLNHPDGFSFGARRFTVSTVGLIPGIRRFASEHRQYNLAISLHAADDRLRSSLIPINRKYPLDELFTACREYIYQTHRRISFEWALIKDVNDSPEQAHLLARRLAPFIQKDASLCHVNVIPLNPTHGYAGEATTRQRASAFKSILESKGVPCTIRLRRGIDIQAGCGQLAGEKFGLVNQLEIEA